MKRVGRSKRITNEKPSEFLQRMNDTLHQLPAERRERRSHSVDSAGSVCLSARKNVSAESEEVNTYGFTSKRPVSGHSRNPSPRNFLAHEEACYQPATPRSARQHKADQRFDEVVAHMKATSGLQKEATQSIKVKSENTDRLLYSEQVVKHAI